MWIYVKMSFILVIKSEFSASLLQSSVSHDSSEIVLIYWFAAQETFLIIINIENSCAASYSVETDLFSLIGLNVGSCVGQLVTFLWCFCFLLCFSYFFKMFFSSVILRPTHIFMSYFSLTLILWFPCISWHVKKLLVIGGQRCVVECIS